MTCQEVSPLLNALLDGELDAAQRTPLDAHLRGCASCAAALRELESVRDTIRTDRPYHYAPAGLRDQVRFALRASQYVERPPKRTHWPAWVAAAAAVGFLAVISTPFLLRNRAERQVVAEELVSAHERALLGHEIDVISTDRHTVKPWFNGRVPFSPPVADLAADGFPLQGGRLDSVAGHPVAALVYARRLHRIDVFAWPVAGGAVPSARFDRDGYHEISWSQDGFAFAAISDLSPGELATFVRLLQAFHA